MRIDCDAARWFPALGPERAALVRLICFPHAGGSASAFASWAPRLPRWAELRALQLPGRANRLREPPIDSMSVLIPILLDTVRALPPLPTVFFGHSNGALIAFELAYAAEQSAGFDLAAIVISSEDVPERATTSPCRHLLPADALIEELRRFGGTESGLLRHRDFLMQMLPAVRADFRLAETHTHSAGRRLDAVGEIWWGTHDDTVATDAVRAWRGLFHGPVAEREFCGGHFYFREAESSVIAALERVLATAPRETLGARTAS